MENTTLEFKGYLIGNSTSKTVSTPQARYNLTVFKMDTPDFGKITVALYTDYYIQLRDDEYIQVNGMIIDERFLAHDVKVLEA